MDSIGWAFLAFLGGGFAGVLLMALMRLAAEPWRQATRRCAPAQTTLPRLLRPRPALTAPPTFSVVYG